MSESKREFAETRLGKFGAFLPIASMIGGILIMAIFGMRGIKNMWAACFVGLIAGWAVFKDSKRFQKAVSDGVRSPILGSILPIMILSCVLAKILVAGHLGDALLYWATRINLSPALMPLLTFVIASIMSISTGSSGAAMASLPPVVLTVAYAMGCNPGLCTGALISGAVVGDNLAPISDSTIVSAMTQEVDVTKAFRYRVKYSAAAYVVSAVLYVIFGVMMAPSTGAGELVVDSTYATSIVFLVVPIILLVIMLKTSNFFNAVLIGTLVGTVLLFAFNYMTPALLFSGDGPIISGIVSASDSVIFLILIFVIISLTKETGCMQIIQNVLTKEGDSARRSEISCGLLAILGTCMIGSGTSAISFSGPVIRNIMKPTKVSRARTASITGGICQALGFTLPWSVTAASYPARVASFGAAPETFSSLDFLPFTFYCFLLFIIYWVLILTGIDLKIETDEELAADGVSAE